MSNIQEKHPEGFSTDGKWLIWPYWAGRMRAAIRLAIRNEEWEYLKRLSREIEEARSYCDSRKEPRPHDPAGGLAGVLR